MKLLTIMNAVGAFTKLANSDMSLPNAYRLQKLVTSVQTEVDFFNGKKQAIVEKYAVNGTIPEDKLSDAQRELDGLMELDVQTAFEVMKLTLDENIRISASDIGFIKPFVEFMDGNAEDIQI